ncbi:hypothetical protein, partial [Fulvivirga aurantia]|uniref:hypothetical protein n=1 Tax=Fulvivirga aurantia TaxID=2529383 RepID=UPI001629D3DB
SCELATVHVENQNQKGLKSYDASKNNEEQEVYTIAEVFSAETAEAELKAISEGFEPEIGVEKRVSILENYMQWSEEEMYIGVAPVRPIGPMPKPVCPPRPRNDCKYPRIITQKLELLVYCEIPDMINASIETKEGTMAVIGNIEYNEKYNEAVISFEVINEDLLHHEAMVYVTTGIFSDGEPKELQVKAAVAEGIFE